MFSLPKAAAWAKPFVAALAQPRHQETQSRPIYFTASSSSSLLRLQSRDPKQFNSDFILFQRSLLTFLSSFPGTCLTLMWVPAMKDYRAALVSAKAADHSRVSTPSDALDERPSPAKWKSLSRLRAFSNWRKEWLRSRAANTPTTTHPDRRDNHAYSLSIYPTYDAPSGHNHPLCHAPSHRPCFHCRVH
ncbi:hypothetical protein B0F90DRAFT_1223890 [Multifurca ochricompacta]|uniref:Uncharacterized protein n=1 Tax=Multifurca ochricompacta TaxID=376703 RepID=A0AAD4LZR4_9AGAM|nr:hypothetical protein B0F90DRAFT_1223890 [Multifurca ochricompacta]